VGPIIDKYGPRYIVIAIGSAISLGCLGVGLSTNRISFVISYLIVRSFGVGVVILTTTTAVSNWFIRKRGRAIALTSLGFPIGIMISVPISQYLLNILDWRTIWIIFAFVAPSVLIPSSVFLHRRPEDRGIYPDGELINSQKDYSIPNVSIFEPTWTTKQAINTSAFWNLTLSMLVFSLSSSGVTFHMIPFMLTRGMELSASALIVSLYAICSGAGALIGGIVAERIDIKFGLSWAFISVTFGLIAFLILPIPIGPICYGVFFGSAQGSKLAMEPIAWADYFGRKSLGKIRALSTPFYMIGLAIGPVIGGITIDNLGNYTLMFAALIVASSICGGSVLMIKKPVHKTYPSIPTTR